MQSASKNARIAQIEGLRAICVILVLIFHVDPNWLPSGYLGVDAFFAVSGYVITRMIAAQQTRGSFSFVSFYSSRFARLFPALMTVILVSFALFWWLYPSSDFIAFSRSALASALAISNIYFYLDAGYFSESSIFKPLLHTWSLGVEEQFYLLWPLLLLGLLRFRIARSSILGAASLAFFGVALFVALSDSSMAFYLTPFRMYQFTIGAAFAVLPLRPMRGAYGLSAAVTIAMSLICLPEYAPGLPQTMAQALITVIVAAACWGLECCEATAGASSRSLLGNPVATLIGGASYCIYLTHWPIVTAAFVLFGPVEDQSLSLKMSILSAGILSGIMLSRSVEKPLRFTSRMTSEAKRRRMTVAASLLAMCVAAGGVSSGLQVAPSAVAGAAPTKQQLKEEIQSALAPGTCNIDLSEEPFEIAGCLDSGRTNILVVGDSVSLAILVGLQRQFPDVNVIRAYREGCPPYFGQDETVIEETLARLERCRLEGDFLWRSFLVEFSEVQHLLDGVIVSGNWNAISLREGRLLDNLHTLERLGIPAAVVGVQPLFSQSPLRLFEQGIIQPGLRSDLSPVVPVKGYGSEQVAIDLTLSEAIAQLSNVSYIDVRKVLCTPKCVSHSGNDIMYLDKGHMTLAGADEVAQSGAFDDFVAFVRARDMQGY